MKLLTLLLLINTAFSMGATPPKKDGASALPLLHEIKRVTLETPYSCNGSYKKSALFLSSYSKDRNSPDLLYNGACNPGDNYIEASTAGDDFSLISDLGNISLTEVTAAKSFNFQRTVGKNNNFKATQEIKVGHVYVVLTSKSEIRSLVAYKVVDQTIDGKMTLEYAVKSYSIQYTTEESKGFDWEQKNK